MIFAFTQLTIGQNIENLGKGEVLKMSGNIAVGATAYSVTGRENRRSPFSYFISANPVFSIYGFDIPVTFIYRDQQGSVSTPFNRINIRPTYKWATLHIGATNLPLSPYILNGQVINGLGVELKPGKFNFSSIYGRLENPLAQLDTLVEGTQLLETYQRNAVAVKIGFGSKRNNFNLIGFRAKDDISSADLSLIDPLLVRPEENIVIGTEFSISPIKQVRLHASAAGSALTSNQESVPLDVPELTGRLKNLDDFYTLNISSKLQFAGDAGIDFKFKSVGFGFEYRRVDPFYKSLGTYYFQEDYENFTFKLNFALAKNKIRFNGRGGLQRNNITKLRSITSSRKIANASITISPSRAFMVTARYSNFQTDRNPEVSNLNDSLRLTRTTAVYGATSRLIFGGKEVPHSITASANYQNLEDVLNAETRDLGIDNYNGNLTYAIQWRQKAMSISASALFNQNNAGERENRRLGGNLRWTKKFMNKKLSLNTSAGYILNYLNGDEDGNSITGRIGFNYKINSQYRTSFNLNYLNRTSLTNDFQEFRGNVKFIYKLNPPKTKSK